MFARFFGIAFGVWFAAGAIRANGPGLVLLVLIAMWLCYRAGRWRRAPSSIAIAEARAAATSAVQVNVGGYHPERARPTIEHHQQDHDLIAIDTRELAANVAGELDPGESSEEYVEWLAAELMRAGSSDGDLATGK